MDSKSATILALTLGVVVLALGIAGIAIATDDGDVEEPADGAQYWYDLQYQGYTNTEGTVVYGETDDSNVSKFNLAIYSQENGMFSGAFRGCPIVGTISDDIIMFYYDLNGVRVLFTGQIEGDLMYVINTSVYSNGKTAAFATVCSTDPTAEVPALDCPKITGDWTSQSSRYLEGADLGYVGAGGLFGKALTVTEQHGAVFCGTMEQDFEGDVADTQFVGAITAETVEGNRLAFLLDENGENWYALIGDDYLLLQTVIIYGNDLYDHIASAGERLYTRGAEVQTDFFTVPDLTARPWTEKDGYASLMLNEVQRTFGKYTLDITDQSGRLFVGVLYAGGVYYDVAGFFYGSDRLFYQTISTENSYDFNQSFVGFATLDNGEIKVLATAPRETENTDQRKMISYLTLTDFPAVPSDITGHWSRILSQICYEDGTTQSLEYQDLLSSDQSSLAPYDLQIISQQGESVLLNYCGKQIAATYGSTLFFTAEVQDADGRACTVYFTGSVLNDHIMNTQILCDYGNGEVRAIISYYSTDYTVILPEGTYLQGSEWTIADDMAYQYTADGTETALLGDRLSLMVFSDFCYGHIEEEVDGALAEKTFIGIVYAQMINGDFSVRIIDSTGIVYLGSCSGGLLTLMTATVSDTGDREFVSAVRTYHTAGSTATVTVKADLDGTVWTADRATVLAADGSIRTAGGVSLSLTQSAQSGLLTGTVTFGDRSGTFVGYDDGRQLVLSFGSGEYYCTVAKVQDRPIGTAPPALQALHLYLYSYGENGSQSVLIADLTLGGGSE